MVSFTKLVSHSLLCQTVKCMSWVYCVFPSLSLSPWTASQVPGSLPAAWCGLTILLPPRQAPMGIPTPQLCPSNCQPCRVSCSPFTATAALVKLPVHHCIRIRRRRVETRQGVRLDVPGSWAIRQGKVKPVKQKGPPGLPGVEALRHPEILQVPVICPNGKARTLEQSNPPGDDTTLRGTALAPATPGPQRHNSSLQGRDGEKNRHKGVPYCQGPAGTVPLLHQYLRHQPGG